MARIAWIEDDHKRISPLVSQLENEGHIILPYDSWQKLNKDIKVVLTCDAIILDIMLPPLDEDPYSGLSILKQLRTQHNYQGPVVICSRVKNPVVLGELRELGVAEILHKPVRPSVLYEAVTKALAGE